MHLSSVLAVLSFGSALAAPVVQQPLAESGHDAGPQAKPYTPENRDPYDKKIDTVKDKLQPLPWVSTQTFYLIYMPIDTTRHLSWDNVY
jgi:hypothetical protein